jgi:hypothetical protein
MANNQKAPEKEKITTPVDENINETPKVEDVKENDVKDDVLDEGKAPETVEGSQEAPKAEETQENEGKNEVPKVEPKKEEKKDEKVNETPKTDAKNKKIKIREGFWAFRVDGKLYQEGDEIEISEKKAKEIWIL